MVARRLLTATAALAAALVAPPAGSAAPDPIQPGDFIAIGNSGCTAGFVFDGVRHRRGRLYVSTAAHCARARGDDVRSETGQVFGDVVAMGDPDDPAADWALIEVRRAHLRRVSGRVKGHPTYPRGVTRSGETRWGDAVQFSGYGIGFDVARTTRESRRAVLTWDDRWEHAVAGPVSWGDSGGPLVHVRTGKALGLVSHLCAGTCTEIGPTIEGIVARAARAGFPVRLRTR